MLAPVGVECGRVSQLPAAPLRLHDDSGTLRVGKYRGQPGAPFWPGLGGLAEWTRRKRWTFVSLGGPEVLVGLAVVDLGYGGHAFLYAFDRAAGRFLAEGSRLAMPWHTRHVAADGAARFRGGGLELKVHPCLAGLRARLGAMQLDASLDLHAHEALAVVAPVPERPGNCTLKRAGVPCRGTLHVEGRALALEVAGTDITDGYPPRHTRWRWAMASGLDPQRGPVGFNLVEGFNEAPGVDESAAWVKGAVQGLGRARFTRQQADQWRLETACRGLAVDFAPLASHQEARNLILVRSRFRQLVGRFTGRFPWGEGELLGVLEDQDVHW